MPEDDGSPPQQSGYSLPYYTRDGGDTEYLISNAGPGTVTGSLVVFGPDCKPRKPVRITVGPNCTQSVRVRPIVPDNAGHSVLAVSQPLVISILYTRGGDLALVGNANVGADALAPWLPGIRAKTYAFGFRTQPLGTDTLEGALFVSNPNTANLGGVLTLYDEKCQSLGAKKFSVKPGCTQELRFPPGRYGYGEVRVLAPAVLNVLHFAKSAGGLTAAELLGEANCIQEPPPPPGAGLLIDYTHGCRGAASGDMTVWEAALTAAGITVTLLTTPPVTAAALQPYKAFAVIMPHAGYTSAETQAISDFVTAGGGLLVGQDYGVDPAVGGPMPWSWPARSVLGAFGLIDDNNMATDALHNDGGPGNVVFEAALCFKPHPVVAGLKAVSVSATSTFSNAAGWTTIVETDTDAAPPSQPVLVEQAVGSGRVLVGGDTNWWADGEIGKYDNQAFGVRCAERVLFKI